MKKINVVHPDSFKTPKHFRYIDIEFETNADITFLTLFSVEMLL